MWNLEEEEAGLVVDDVAFACAVLDLPGLVEFVVRRLEECAALVKRGHDPHVLRMELQHELRDLPEGDCWRNTPDARAILQYASLRGGERRAGLTYVVARELGAARARVDVASSFGISHRALKRGVETARRAFCARRGD